MWEMMPEVGRQMQGSVVKAEPFKDQSDDKRSESVSLSLSPLCVGKQHALCGGC